MTRKKKSSVTRVPPKTAVRQWLKEVGLAVPRKRDWCIQFVLMTTGKTPPAIMPSRPTSFGLGICDDWWWVRVEHAGRQFGWQEDTEVGPHFTFTTWKAIQPPDSLATVFDWLTNVEAKVGKPFRRDKPAFQSDVKGAAQAVRTWLRSLPASDEES